MSHTATRPTDKHERMSSRKLNHIGICLGHSYVIALPGRDIPRHNVCKQTASALVPAEHGRLLSAINGDRSMPGGDERLHVCLFEPPPANVGHGIRGRT
jgi:hypothetical protein